MTKRAKLTPTEVIVSPENQESILKFCTKIVANGFCSAKELQQEFGDEVFTKMIAILFKTHRLMSKVTRAWKDGKNAEGYEWADRRFSKAQMKRIPPELQVVIQQFKKPRTIYGDYATITLDCEWTNIVIGAIPNSDGEDKYNRFDRGPDGAILIPAYCLRAMAAKALPQIGKEQAIARRIGWSSTLIEKPIIKRSPRPVIGPDGHTGLGLNDSEQLPIGTQFSVTAVIPTTMITEDEFVAMMTHAGRFVRFSPARSAGFGDFKILRVS